jgi:hypothetical protein
MLGMLNAEAAVRFIMPLDHVSIEVKNGRDSRISNGVRADL